MCLLTNNILNVGNVISVKDGIIKVANLPFAASGEMVLFEIENHRIIKGMVCNIDETIDIVLFGEDKYVHEGTKVYQTNSLFKVPVGLQLFGKVIDSLGKPIDLNSLNIKTGEEYEELWLQYPGCEDYIEKRAPAILDRQPVNQPLQTGIKAIDSLIPIGRGQRELIIGDRQTGKASLIFDIMLNLKRENMVNELTKTNEYELEQLTNTIWVIYVLIGHRKARVAQIWKDILAYNMEKYISIVGAFSSDPAPLQFLAAYAGCTQGEYVRDILQGDCVIFYNDLSKHAIAYRQMSLLLRRPSGREAYPGDIFYIHSRLLERAAKLSDEFGGGSLTALPVVETQAGDITAYIPTNIISITDGQIFLESSLFYKGIRPAINVGLSVSRVGSNAQVKKMKQLAGTLKLTLAQFREVEIFSRLAVNLTNTATINLIKRGKILTQLFIQKERKPVHLITQLLILYSALFGYVDNMELTKVTAFADGFNVFMNDYLQIDYFMERDMETIDDFCNDNIFLEFIIEIYHLFLNNLHNNNLKLQDEPITNN